MMEWTVIWALGIVDYCNVNYLIYIVIHLLLHETTRCPVAQ